MSGPVFKRVCGLSSYVKPNDKWYKPPRSKISNVLAKVKQQVKLYHKIAFLGVLSCSISVTIGGRHHQTLISNILLFRW